MANGWVHGERFHAVSAVTGCIGMVNVSGVWLTGGLSSDTQDAHQARSEPMELRSDAGVRFTGCTVNKSRTLLCGRCAH